MNEVLTQTWPPGGRRIFAQADGSSGAESLRRISSRTVRFWPLFTRVTISLFNRAWPRTLTLLATTTAGPATSGGIFKSAAGSDLAAFFCELFFLLLVFFVAALVTALGETLAAFEAVEVVLVTAGAGA